jgi:hypothetical protein
LEKVALVASANQLQALWTIAIKAITQPYLRDVST